MNLFSLMERSSEHFGTIEIPQPKKLGVLQFNPDRQSPSANVRFLVRRLADISNALIVLPEFFLTHYSYGALFNFSRVELETILLPLTKLAETNSVSLVGSMPVDKFGRSSNEALMISGGGIHHLYNKQRLFGDEWDRFSPGMEPCRMVSAGGLLTKVQVCFDLTVPLNSGPAVDADLDILLIPSAVSIDYLHHIARSRAIEGQCIAAICNRSGTERSGTQFLGRSAIYFADGSYQSLADNCDSGLLITDLTDEQFRWDRSVRMSLRPQNVQPPTSAY